MIELVSISHLEKLVLEACALKIINTAIVPAPAVIGKVMGKNNLLSILASGLKFLLSEELRALSVFGERKSHPILQIIIPPPVG